MFLEIAADYGYIQPPMDALDVVNVIAALAGFAVIVWLVVYTLRGDPERAKEEAARRYFDEHGAWPD